MTLLAAETRNVRVKAYYEQYIYIPFKLLELESCSGTKSCIREKRKVFVQCVPLRGLWTRLSLRSMPGRPSARTAENEGPYSAHQVPRVGMVRGTFQGLVPEATHAQKIMVVYRLNNALGRQAINVRQTS